MNRRQRILIAAAFGLLLGAGIGYLSYKKIHVLPFPREKWLKVKGILDNINVRDSNEKSVFRATAKANLGLLGVENLIVVL